MSAQDKTEEVLRKIHLLFSKAEPYQKSKKKVVVNKEEVMTLFKELNVCLNDLQDEYGLTEAGRDAAVRRMQKQQDDIILAAERKADDVYAASIMYTDDALRSVEKIVENTNTEMLMAVDTFKQELANAKADLRTNRMDLKAQLSEMRDAQKYIRLIDDENLRLAKEEAIREDIMAAKNANLTATAGFTDADTDPDESEKSPYADSKPKIRVNAAYFEEHGIPLNEDDKEDSEKKDRADSDVPINTDDLDAEYFAWKAEDDAASEAEKKEAAGIVESLKDQFKNIFK